MIKSLKKENTNLSETYSASKTELTRLHQSLLAENQSLSRSVARLKSLLEDSTQNQTELEMKLSGVQSENSGLHRQLAHLRKEYKYTKDML